MLAHRKVNELQIANNLNFIGSPDYSILIVWPDCLRPSESDKKINATKDTSGFPKLYLLLFRDVGLDLNCPFQLTGI